jgi:hypothetical protein
MMGYPLARLANDVTSSAGANDCPQAASPESMQSDRKAKTSFAI